MVARPPSISLLGFVGSRLPASGFLLSCLAISKDSSHLWLDSYLYFYFSFSYSGDLLTSFLRCLVVSFLVLCLFVLQISYLQEFFQLPCLLWCLIFTWFIFLSTCLISCLVSRKHSCSVLSFFPALQEVSIDTLSLLGWLPFFFIFGDKHATICSYLSVFWQGGSLAFPLLLFGSLVRSILTIR